MQNGKLLPSHRNVVIQSIKPKRPNYPANQKLVPVKEVLREWDQLDAYYRGQLLQLNDKSQKKSIKKKSKEKSSSNKQYAPEDLFGDENSFYGNDEQIKGEKDDYESDLDNYDYYDDKKCKTESKGVKFSCNFDRENHLENYLAISQEDFTIRLDGNNKKRCCQKGKNQKMLRPVLASIYQPPVAAGFNSIHIQKILYHKCTTESPERFSTGTIITPSSKDSLKEDDKEKLTIKPNVPKLKDSNSTVSNNTKISAVPHLPITTNKKNKNKELLSNTQQSNNPANNNNNNTSTKNKNLEKKYNKSCDNENISSEQQKKKSEGAERQKSKRKMDSESPVPVSSTSELFEKTTSPVNKKQKLYSSSSVDEREHSSDLYENGQKQCSPTEIRESVTPKGGTTSLVNTIVNQSRKSFQSVNKKDSDIRQRQRNLESKRRKCYALKKGQEQEELESIDLAFKTFELILDFPPLSPIRSPPMSRWS